MESTPEGKKLLSHDWFVAGVTFIVTFISAVVVNLIIFSYGQGKIEHRIETLEARADKLDKDWQLARDRMERALRDVRQVPQHEQFTSPVQPR